MGGTGGETEKANPAASPTTFAGSRAALNTAATPTWAGIMSETSPAADPVDPYAKLSASPLAVNPTVAPTAVPTGATAGFTSTPYPTGDLPHIGAPDSAIAPAEAAAKEFAAPTSFRPIYEATAAASEKLSSNPIFQKGWESNPAAVQLWLQAVADAGGDFRVQDKYYNPVGVGSSKVYWPGDPARPK